MNKTELFEAVGGIDDRYILEAKNVSHKSHRAKIMLLAASVAVIAVLIAALAIGIASRQTPKAPDVPPAVTTVKTLPYAVVPKTIPPVPEDTDKEQTVLKGARLICIDEKRFAESYTGGVLTHVFYLKDAHLAHGVTYYRLEIPEGVELITPQEFIFDPTISPYFEISYRLLDNSFDICQIDFLTKKNSEEEYKHRAYIFSEREDGYDYSAYSYNYQYLPNGLGISQYLGYGDPIDCGVWGGAYQNGKIGEDISRSIQIQHSYRFKKWHITLQTTNGIILKTDRDFVLDYTKTDMFDVVFGLADGYDRGAITVMIAPEVKYAGVDETIVVRFDCQKSDDSVFSQCFVIYRGHWDHQRKNIADCLDPNCDIGKVLPSSKNKILQ